MLTDDFLNNQHQQFMQARHKFATLVPAALGKYCRKLNAIDHCSFEPFSILLPTGDQAEYDHAVVVIRLVEHDELRYRFYSLTISTQEEVLLSHLDSQTSQNTYVTVSNSFLQQYKLSLKEYAQWMCVNTFTMLALRP